MDIGAQDIIQSIINGLCMGGTYVLIGLGLTLILGIMNILQFAHGEVYMIGAFTVYFLCVLKGINLYLAVFISMITTAIFGLILERVFLRPLKGLFLSYVCVTTGLSLILQTGVMLIFSKGTKQLPSLWQGSFNLAGVYISRERVIAIVMALLLTLALQTFLKRTKYGLAMVASAQHREGALMQGIDPNVMSAMVVAIGSGLAAVGGALGGSIFNLDPYMGGLAFMKGITLIVIGGLGSVPGAVAGGLILGIVESLLALFFGSQMGIILPLVLVIAFLIFRPRGLFGHD
ncbi:MAG: branched-chain amino acid ABC transporter permease [Thermoleophilia bacterium]|nr:branched-chain amino acid ABC transporter permease [Thermoleophilia bacterium]